MTRYVLEGLAAAGVLASDAVMEKALIYLDRCRNLDGGIFFSTVNLDTKTSSEVLGIFQRLNAQEGLTIVLVTHEPDIAEYATRVVAFRDGIIRSDHPVAQRRDAARELERFEREAELAARTA